MSEPMKCNCRGIIGPRRICSYVTVGGNLCTAPVDLECQHKVAPGSETALEKCYCMNECGDDDAINKGTRAPCRSHQAYLYDHNRFNRVQQWKSTSADDLKTTLACLVNRDPADAAEDCLFALILAGVKGKTHRKHIAAALRAASKQLEEVPHD